MGSTRWFVWWMFDTARACAAGNAIGIGVDFFDSVRPLGFHYLDDDMVDSLIAHGRNVVFLQTMVTTVRSHEYPGYSLDRLVRSFPELRSFLLETFKTIGHQVFLLI